MVWASAPAPEQRQGYFTQACGGDEALLRELLSKPWPPALLVSGLGLLRVRRRR